MHDNRSHPLLQQVPLTVSPFINLPSATTLPYTYKSMPSTLPPSTTGIGTTSSSSEGEPESAPPKPKYVISSSGHAAHPDDIIASCRALQAHVAKLQADAESELSALDERIRARELAEKRRVAPGWLDSEARLLEPERKSGGGGDAGSGGGWQLPGIGGELAAGAQDPQRWAFAQPSFGRDGHGPGGASEMAVPDEGEELDRAFGVLALGQR
ncbi:hypothetical protein B0H67DRAFT_599668 [Lasiosphaeris hirsuta]|uniref:Uncharacterized protein n=1 Tax=Lasiosphaeris hirsuta TaxID=260670 RepID=A0AA40AQD7_9PEZI|nr:hypothetical protein B0H67DRAFT_599668 [Lasiosphaeris hirsuta]